MPKETAAGDPAFLEQQRKRLTAMRDQLRARKAEKPPLDRTTRPDGAEEMEDEAQKLAQSEVDDAVHFVEEQRLRLIERALAKIDEGTYGLSDASGDPIPRARLEAVPEAVLTIQEEAAREKRQRR